jgi:hypothetical protein
MKIALENQTEAQSAQVSYLAQAPKMNLVQQTLSKQFARVQGPRKNPVQQALSKQYA